ncbi:unnamed protein product [Adineta steineri]|uniref:NHL repeat containing protein-like protein n=1 Tax=Adineta steineri TaxID=433720 RepID=A0A814RQ14_9BILA|nr:unnamed protein product [Adineta steineri]CAF1137215.1 unnamed protein product [Adineta steineri]CAF3963632.1 unnamed protein product [Adineta steineri]CAF4136848.1 unnamed protein product [Adineta steineri]
MNGKTVAGGHGEGNALYQLNSSYGLFVDSNDAVFVADYFNHRVVKWDRDAVSGFLWAGGHCGTSEQGKLCLPTALTFDKEGTLFVTVEEGRNGSVIRWKKGATAGDRIINASTSLYGIALDKKEEYFYVGHHRENRVVKYTKNGQFVGVVAGGDGQGEALSQLDYPRGVAVDDSGAVYVADSNNHRVMKWMANAKEGTIVAGGNGNGSRTDQLSLVGGITLDEQGTIYVVDEYNHRVMSIPVGTRNGTIIAGGHGSGSASNQFNGALSLAFNNDGDLFVSDWNNWRVQMFKMDKSPSSGSNYICAFASKWTLFTCFLLLMILYANLLE